jgi:hypothetical protein
MTGSSVCFHSTKGTWLSRDANAICCGLEHCPMAVSTLFRLGGTRSIWFKTKENMSTCTSGFARCSLLHQRTFAWSSTDRLRSGTRIRKCALSWWTRRETSSRRSRCRGRVARRSGRALSFIPTSVSSAICVAQLCNETEEATNQGRFMRGLVKDTTLLLKFAHVRRRFLDCDRSRPRSGRPGALDFVTMPKRQAADGEVTDGVMATYEHG